MDSRPLYHERQHLALCAKHTLNNIVQENAVSQEDLNRLAMEVDKLELELGIRDTNSISSNHYDPHQGNYSIEVITRAFQMTNLDLISINSNHERAIAARMDHDNADAYICNIQLNRFMNHWFGIGKFGGQWYNLDSRLTRPELLKVNGSKIELLARNNFLALYVVAERT